jgi:hypothetical protein
MNWIRRYFRPLNLYARDREFYRRHGAGPVSSRDIVAIEYGTFPPKGWTVKDKPYQNRPVDIVTPLTDKENGPIKGLIYSVLTLGYVHSGKNRKDISDGPEEKKPQIALNKLIFSPVGQGGMLYIAKGMVTTLAAAAATLNPLTVLGKMPLLAYMCILTSLRNQPLTQILTLPFRPAMDTIGHENVHVLQTRDPYETRTGYNIFRNSFKERALEKIEASHVGNKARNFMNNAFSFSLASYFMNDYEIQARMNTLLTHGYQRWGRMPETKHELWAALLDAGLRAPRSIHEELRNSTEDVSDFYKPGLTSSFNRAAKQMLAPHIAELNTGYWSLVLKDSKTDYWQRTLPYLYGHLAELCGDERGLLKMGYTGPVLDKAGPVPADPQLRETSWNSSKDYAFEMEEAKVTEAKRGLWFADDGVVDHRRRFNREGRPQGRFADVDYYDDEGVITALRARHPADARVINTRTLQ